MPWVDPINSSSSSPNARAGLVHCQVQLSQFYPSSIPMWLCVPSPQQSLKGEHGDKDSWNDAPDHPAKISLVPLIITYMLGCWLDIKNKHWFPSFLYLFAHFFNDGHPYNYFTEMFFPSFVPAFYVCIHKCRSSFFNAYAGTDESFLVPLASSVA